MIKINNQKTQKQIAQDLNLTPQTLSNYIQGKTDPDIKTLIKLADYFHTTVDNLIGHNVPYLIDKSIYNEQQLQLFDIILQLNHVNTLRAISYCAGLLAGQN